MTANDTAEAAGYSLQFNEKISYDDLEGDNEYIFSPSNYSVWYDVEPQYAELIEALSTNDTGDEFLQDGVNADDIKRYQWIVTGFPDVEEAVLDILKSNIAANLSTSADYISPERITVIDYVLNNSIMNIYFSAHFAEAVRDQVDDVLTGSGSAALTLSIFGIKFNLGNTLVPVSAMPASIQGNILEDIGGQILNIGKAIVSVPMTILEEAKDILIDKPLEAIGGGIKEAASFVKGAFDSVLSAPGNFIKTVGNTAGDFVAKAGPAVTNLVGEGGKLVGGAFNGIIGGAKSIIGQFTPIIIIVGIVGVGFILVFLVMQSRKNPIVP
jgi:hypothetical protein